MTARVTPAREGGGRGTLVQDTLEQALVRPSARRIWVHLECGGWVLFSLAGGFCLECDAGPLRPEEYAKPP
jgi:hypothetical protein